MGVPTKSILFEFKQILWSIALSMVWKKVGLVSLHIKSHLQSGGFQKKYRLEAVQHV